MPTLIPYLAYDGNCAEALRFYEQALGGTIELLVRGADTPMAGQMPKEYANRIMHGRLSLPGGAMLYAGDCPPHITYQGIHGVSVAVNFESVSRATQAFNALAHDGKVTMPLQPTFWAKMSGMVTDAFGVPWIINGELLPVAAQSRSTGE